MERTLMPTELTAENGAKALLIGEFKETISLACPECYNDVEPDDECDICHGEGKYIQPVDVQWTTIKAIYAMAVEHFGKDGEEVGS